MKVRKDQCGQGGPKKSDLTASTTTPAEQLAPDAAPEGNPEEEN
eukprot:gene15194-21268_t